MKLRTLMLGGALALTAVTGMAQADTAPVVTPYHYGEKMDVQKVLAMHETDTNVCKVINADIKYLDSAGKVQDVSYRKMSEACDFQN
ncbi:DUF2790 domain-containing protein [Pseudomonas yamanorum]|jgi:hypothetical protein|uniref:DUF2790 domain-containing protein n=1 Tax=Pseudomonas yamanorum TaxID=515393 RepID=A0A7Y8JQV4_9PSED|nr:MULTISPECIES: DUF2790 domain-containing protein [Pseudomonas]MCS3419928.1 hypothetical protein [Pseudomonas sp. BIGb0558]MCS3437830.1 hypothetical protein [Pseudomonas sp. BIGb0450]NVZ83429.1 DUF2790 domain-containing protein [Pseudomonas yamanorum]NWD27823.1 DUF2790 domain-containing protein [Pseudomonas yamanorum]NWE14865.1 DUF2790 domain-containing protein [Pseudomonas yamanorum]